MITSVTLTVTQRIAVYSAVHCLRCQRQVMAMPGTPTVEVRIAPMTPWRSGRGAVVKCKKCAALCEVIVHAH